MTGQVRLKECQHMKELQQPIPSCSRASGSSQEVPVCMVEVGVVETECPSKKCDSKHSTSQTKLPGEEMMERHHPFSGSGGER